MTMWLPHGWWIEVEGRIKHFAFHAGVENLVKIESPAKFRSAKAASKAAENALRLMAYEIRDVGWTKFRCHSRIPGTYRAYCGVNVGDNPNLQNHETPPCGNCYRILESIPYPESPEADVKKHFRYVSFNSERIPVGLQPALEKLKGENYAWKKTATEATTEPKQKSSWGKALFEGLKKPSIPYKGEDMIGDNGFGTTEHALKSARDALWAIANMQITETTDKSEVLALCISIAKLELEKCSTAGK